MTDRPDITPPTPEEFENPDMTEALAQLREPGRLLAEALVRIRNADQQMVYAPDSTTHEVDRARHELDVATALTLLVDATIKAVAYEESKSTVMTAVDGNLDWSEVKVGGPFPAAREYEPQPVNGVRFTVDLRGSGMGVVAGREWLHVPGHGFIDISEAEEAYGPEGTAPYRLTGRVVSGTPDHILGITDGGLSVALPRALIVESPDE